MNLRELYEMLGTEVARLEDVKRRRKFTKLITRTLCLIVTITAIIQTVIMLIGPSVVRVDQTLSLILIYLVSYDSIQSNIDQENDYVMIVNITSSSIIELRKLITEVEEEIGYETRNRNEA